MNPQNLTIGDITPYIDTVKQLLGSLKISSFDDLFDRIESLLNSSGYMTGEIKQALDTARAELKANPGLFEQAKGDVVAYIEMLASKYPASTRLVDIPELQMGGGDSGGGSGSGSNVITIGDLDIATFQAQFKDVFVSFNPHTGVVTVNGAGYNFQQPDVERLKFSDGVLAFDFDGVAGQMFRLYQAAFNREPDDAGLGYWINYQDGAQTELRNIANSFFSSPEFIALYGSEDTVSNSAFVSLLYTNTLSREFDQAGFDWWLAELDAGRTTRIDMLASFSESAENQARTADAIADGIWFV